MPKKDWMVNETDLNKDDQLLILQSMLDKSCIVQGCAGSGKSVLALIKAQRIQREKGDDYQIIVFTKALARFMNAGREYLGLNNTFTYYDEWVKKGLPHSKYLIVDEIQDFTPEQIQQFVQACDVFFFFGDSAQSLYRQFRNTIDVDELYYISSVQQRHPKLWELYRNYRLPISVAKVAQSVGVDLMPFNLQTYQSKINSVPYILKMDSLEEQIKHVANTIKKNEAEMDDVGILVKDNNMAKRVFNVFKTTGTKCEVKYEDKEDWRNSVNTLNFSTNLPKIMTYHSAKGLQFGAVFLPGITPINTEDRFSDDNRRALYVAMTRTYNHLYIYHGGDIPFPFSNVSPTLYLTSDKTQSVDDI